MVAIIGDASRLRVEVEYREKFAVAPGVGDQSLPAAVRHHAGPRYAVVGMAAEDHVDAAYARGELEVDVHSVMRQQHDDRGAFGPQFVHVPLQRFLANAEVPVSDVIARMRDRRIWERLADNADGHTVDLAQCRGCKHGVAEVRGGDVLREEFDAALEVVVDNLFHALSAEREFPVTGHDVDTEKL